MAPSAVVDGVCSVAVQLGVGEGGGVLERLEVGEDGRVLQRGAQVVFDALDEIVAALDGPVTGMGELQA